MSSPRTRRPAAGDVPLTPMSAAERRGMRLGSRLLIVALAELLLLFQIWQSRTDSPSPVLALFVVPVAMFGLGLLLTTQAHHRLPVAWHVVVALGFGSTLAVPFADVFGGDGVASAVGWWNTLAVYAAVAVQLAAVLAMARPAGSSYITHRKLDLEERDAARVPRSSR